MSAAAPEAGSVVIISQLQPQRHQATGPEEGLTSNAAAPLPKPLVTFYRGEPEALGYIISGSLSVAASVKPTLGKVRSSLVLNIISSVVAGMAIILIGICLPSSYYFYYTVYCAYYKPSEDCEGYFDKQVFLMGVATLLFLLSVLIFTINISTSVFACRTVCRSSYSEMSVVIYQTTSLNVPDTTAALSSDGNIKI
ncbi:membrane-spanning 4-domains subfamily A member 4A-like isoform X2 [Mixophyes fleayi]|uniref:membrane-spanning 4-domains subfamily A member 4A-like isoform X2 n=1 Tax=Mixophyes fleayi TaxID=3061075 RepID=UPI003F4E1146